MDYQKQINIRLTSQDIKKIKVVLKDINKNSNEKKGYRFLIMEYVDNYLNNNNIGLELEKNEIEKQNEKIQEQIDHLQYIKQENNIKLKAIDNELNNKIIYDISNYPYNDNLNYAYNRLKEIVLNNKIKSFDLIENDIKQLETTFKIKEKGLLREIALNHFQQWQNELLIMDTPESNSNKKIKSIGFKIMANFKNSKQPITDLKEYLETNKEFIIKEFITGGVNYNEVKEYLLENENPKK